MRELRQLLAFLEEPEDLPGPIDDLEGAAEVPVGLDLVGDLVVFRLPVVLELPLDEALVGALGHDALAEPDARDAGLGEAELVGPEIEAELAPLEALKNGTLNGAKMMGMEDKLGTLEPNKLADIIAVKGDPLNDIKLLQDHNRIQLVIKEEKIVKNLL